MPLTDRPYRADDYPRVIAFLRACYAANRDQACWLPQRWEDMEFRIDTMHTDAGGESWHRTIRLWEENGDIVAVANGEEGLLAFTQLAPGRERLFPALLDWIEGAFAPRETPDNRLGVVALFSRGYKTEELWRRGYARDAEGCYHNYRYLGREAVETAALPDGYRIVFGDEYPDLAAKQLACEYGFHPEREGELGRDGLGRSFVRRADAPMHNPRYEVMTARGGELCSYLFAYVDPVLNAAMVEPVSTRLAHRRRGLGKAMLLALLARLRGDGVAVCYVESYGEARRRFYASAGFAARDIDYRWSRP